LGKPNPFSLLQSSEGLKPFNYALYVGDAMEDALMVKEANRTTPCFLFAGVYGYSDCKDDVVRDFLAEGADAILPSVNELPAVLKTVKGEKCRENS
jgi:phosphoglycolate phosphatase-like HAD superfamily hydrolase